jgi:predicted nucleic acid-binding protein
MFARIARGELVVQTADTVLFEAAYTMERVYHVPRGDIRDALVSILRLDGVLLPRKELYPDLLDLFVQYKSISFADCYHAVLARALNADGIISFDRDFDRLPAVERREPE